MAMPHFEEEDGFATEDLPEATRPTWAKKMGVPTHKVPPSTSTARCDALLLLIGPPTHTYWCFNSCHVSLVARTASSGVLAPSLALTLALVASSSTWLAKISSTIAVTCEK
eukprot:6460543-Amphidinium_carterae.1